MKTYIVFFNSNGKRKFALCLEEKTTIYQMNEKVSKFINNVCERNKYTFTYNNVNEDDFFGTLKNIPILSVADL